MRDLLVYTRALPGIGMEPLRYYHDDSGLECDAIIELDYGRWAEHEIAIRTYATRPNRLFIKL